MNRQGTTYTIVFSFIVTFAFVFLLALTNQVTIKKVELNQEVARKSAILSAMGIEYTSQQDVLDKYADVQTVDKSGTTLYKADEEGRTVYAKEFAGSGLWSTIRGVLAVNADVSRIIGIEIISQGETPGLGGRIEEPWFKRQFRDESVTGGKVKLNMSNAGAPDESSDNGQVDGITGATITSTSMERIVNGELTTLRSLLGVN